LLDVDRQRYADAMGEGSESPVLPRPGDVLDGKYRLLRVIGEGGMGVVFEAVHEKLGQHVAIKVLQPSVARNVDLVARFEREARAAGRLRGRNVARVTDVEVSPGHLAYMVMEFLVGNDLDAELSSRAGSRMPVAEAVEIVLQACRAIAEAHAAGIVHRDLKPSNLFLCTEGDERVVKLLDFGVSKMEDEASKLTSTQLVVGTVHYMSPEQVRSAKEADARTDIWALGVILY
jgi:serine/threonine protein kinase